MNKCLILAILFTGCASTTSFRNPSGKQFYESRCNSPDRSRFECFKSAKAQCPMGYVVHDKNRIKGMDPVFHVQRIITSRTLVYSCK